MRAIFFVILICISLLARAQTQSWICQGEQYVAIPYFFNSGEIQSSISAKNDQTFVFNENGLQLLGGQILFMPINSCAFGENGRPNCKLFSNTFDIFGAGIFVLHQYTVGDDENLVTNEIVMGKCSRI